MTNEEQRAALQQILALAGQVLEAIPVPDPPPPVPVVDSAEKLVAALAIGGDIPLQAGTYVGNFSVSRPGTVLRGVPRPGRRVTPEDVDGVQLLPLDPLTETLVVNASDVRIEGLTVRNGASDRTCVRIGSSFATDVQLQPARVTLDSIAVIAGLDGGHRGIEAHATDFTLVRSHVSNFWEAGRQSQAFYFLNGPGPVRVEDNYLEGSGENILFGGDSIRIPNLVPADILIRHNDIVKPLSWKTDRPHTVCNSIEFKNAMRVLVEGNLVDGNWKDVQSGHTVVITARNQYGDSPWCIVDDVTIRSNRFRNLLEGTAYAVNIQGHDNLHESQQTRLVTIEDNLFEDARQGVQVNRGVVERLTIRNNTLPRIGGNVVYFVGLTSDGQPLGGFTPLTMERNVFVSGSYGVNSSNKGQGTNAIAWWSNGDYSFVGNVIEKSKDRRIVWPAGNTVLEYGALAAQLDAEFRYIPGGAGYGLAA